ncbi:MAG: class C sortase [Blautia sp.]
MRRKIFNIAVAFLFLVGMGILCYPVVSDWWNQRQQDKISDGYEQTVGGKDPAELEQMRKKAEEYNENLLKDEIIIDPFDQVKEKKVDGDYENTLDIDGNGVMGIVEIPEIHVKLPIYHGTSEEVLQKAIGHLEQTSFPVGGLGTHAVISGHRGLPSAKLFTDLDQVEKGDVFYLHVLEETLAYQVDQIRVVEPNQLEDLAIHAGEDHVTLVTCTPYGVNSHRLLVRGTRIPYEEAKEKENSTVKREETMDWGPYLVLIPVVAVCMTLWLLRRRKKRKDAGR